MKNNRYILTKMENAVDNNTGKFQQTGRVTNTSVLHCLGLLRNLS